MRRFAGSGLLCRRFGGGGSGGSGCSDFQLFGGTTATGLLVAEDLLALQLLLLDLESIGARFLVFGRQIGGVGFLLVL